ncbi:hypothetical protein PR048_018918 [Dryococelus australis]|uniref:Integrase catalytic domain-containing protein n=1 Tax=Dryococelus australis TaxID=614101 RepID=A0ABQ9H210_9NEOP|nr:hypothetical protein PR048_018918 [Dryococelus australis]
MAMASEDFAHVEKLKGHSNFSIWKFQIVVLLKVAVLYNVVSAKFTEGEQDTSWGKKDAKAQKYIVTKIDKGNIQFIISCDSAKVMFDKLRSIYESDSSHNKSSFLWNFFNYKIDKVASVLSDLQTLPIKLESAGHAVGDETMMGGVYVANELTEWSREREIKIYYVPAATPQLNGRADRLNRELMDKMRALIFRLWLRERVVGRYYMHCNAHAEQKPVCYSRHNSCRTVVWKKT